MKNYLTDITGLKVGHAHDSKMGKGVTVVLAENGATPGVDVRGSAPGTRETDLIKSEKLVDKIHAIVLSGGSAYGLEASSGVMDYLEERGIGFETPYGIVPIVSQAVIYDLSSGGPKLRPDKAMGYLAAQNAKETEESRGTIGAGYGAIVSKTMGFDMAVKSGLGSATVKVGDLIVSALVILNSLGDIYQGETQITGPYNTNENRMYNSLHYIKNNKIGFSNTNTTIGVVATNARLDKAKANKLASVAHNGYARSIRPVHTLSDGDTVFSLATGEIDEDNFDLVLTLAVEAVENAVIDAIYSARSENGYLSINDINKRLNNLS